MKKKLIPSIIFLCIDILLLIFVLYFLSVSTAEMLMVYYVLLLPVLVFLIFRIVKLILVFVKNDKAKKATLSIRTVALVLACLWMFYSATVFVLFSPPNEVEKRSYHKYANASNFVDYIETEDTEYGEYNRVTHTEFLGQNELEVVKHIAPDNKDGNIMIDIKYIETKSVFLKFFEYINFQSDINSFMIKKESENCFYYQYEYNEGFTPIETEIIVLGKTDTGFIYARIWSNVKDLPVNVDKTLEYCEALLATGFENKLF